MDVGISVSTYADASAFTFGITFLHGLGQNLPFKCVPQNDGSMPLLSPTCQKTPPKRGLYSECEYLLAGAYASTESESGQTEAEKSERGGFRSRGTDWSTIDGED